jgi:hypothetical protein
MFSERYLSNPQLCLLELYSSRAAVPPYQI